MNCLIVGASGGLGRALCEALAKRGHHLLLAASDERDISAMAADLRLRWGVRVEYVAVHIRPGEPWLEKIGVAAGRFELINALFFPIGFSLDDDCGTLGEGQTRALLESNLVAQMLTTSKFLPAMLEAKQGVVTGFGSIAAVRGRRANVVYAAAKRALVSYFESVRHLTAGTGVRVQFYQMGYLDTQQTFGRKLLFPIYSPHRAAEYVAGKMNTDVGTRFLPRFWGVIALMLRMLPWSIYKRLNF